MHARTLAVGVVIAAAFACSSSDPQVPTPVPTTGLATPAGVVPSTPTPASGFLDDRNCDDFATQDQAQAFFEEGGGPEQDLHDLDPDYNGRACDEAGAAPASPASAAPSVPPATAVPPARAAPTAVASPQQHTQVSGDVEGPQGGSSTRSSCETDGEERC